MKKAISIDKNWKHPMEITNLSSSMDLRFAEIAVEMTERIRCLGPSHIALRLQGRGSENTSCNDSSELA